MGTITQTSVCKYCAELSIGAVTLVQPNINTLMMGFDGWEKVRLLQCLLICHGDIMEISYFVPKSNRLWVVSKISNQSTVPNYSEISYLVL